MPGVAPVLIEVALGDGSDESVWIEADPGETDAGLGLISDQAGRTVGRLSQTLDGCLNPVQAFVSTVIGKLRHAQDDVDEIQVEFSLKLGGETGFVFAKGQAESVLRVVATWRKPRES